MINNKCLKGFTLAEVLITLGIIGIVAAMTIPDLLNNTNDEELKTAFKKSYAEISQMSELLRNDNGGTLNGVFKDGDSNASAMEIIKPYFSKVKACSSDDESCFSQKMYNFKGAEITNGLGHGLILNNGSQITSAGPDWVNSECTNEVDSTCMAIFLDVNGLKKPNRIGKDVFYIKLQANRTVPFGILGDSYQTNCGLTADGTYAGSGCAGWVMQEKDY